MSKLIAWASLALLAVAGCGAAARAASPVASSPLVVMGNRHMLRGVPDCMQANNYSCGVGSAQAVLQYYGIWGYQDELARALGTSARDGTHPARLAAYLNKQGLKAAIQENMSLAELEKVVDEGNLTIIDYQAYRESPNVAYATDWEDGHYSIVVGYDQDKIYIEDPSMFGSVGFLGRNELLTRWRDYEIEQGKRREYVRMGIVVRGKPVPQPDFSHID